MPRYKDHFLPPLEAIRRQVDTEPFCARASNGVIWFVGTLTPPDPLFEKEGEMKGGRFEKEGRGLKYYNHRNLTPLLR